MSGRTSDTARRSSSVIFLMLMSTPAPLHRGASLGSDYLQDLFANAKAQIRTQFYLTHKPSSLFLLRGAESQKRKAGGDRTLSSVHLGMTLPVPVGDISLWTQTAREPWV